jgi:hypothetical protein
MASARRLSRRSAPARASAVLVTRAHRSIRALTREIRDIDRRASHDDTEARVAIGQRLAEVRTKLEHGSWLDWVEHELPFAPRTAQRYLQLSEWAAEHPGSYRRIAPLGTTKTYLLSRLDGAELRAFLRVKEHLVPGSNKRVELALLTGAELALLLRHLLGIDEGPKPAKLMSNYRKRVTGLVQATAELARNVDELDESDVVEVRDQLLKAAAYLDRALR